MYVVNYIYFISYVTQEERVTRFIRGGDVIVVLAFLF